MRPVCDQLNSTETEFPKRALSKTTEITNFFSKWIFRTFFDISPSSLRKALWDSEDTDCPFLLQNQLF